MSHRQDVTSVVYWPPTPPNMPFQRQWKCIFHWRGRAWLTISDRAKIPWYSHRLMHQKRVTCELHNSYFRLMTIKHAIPKTAEVTCSDGQLWGDRRVWRQELVEKASTQQKAALPGLRLSGPGERERNGVMANRVWVNMLQFHSFLRLPLTHNPFKWSERFIFLK